MKILEYGTIKPKQAHCVGCRANIEYTPMDVHKQPCGANAISFFVMCPVCGRWIYVDRKEFVDD